MPTAFDDWRLQTRVTHWNVLPLQASKDQKGYSKTKLIFPPGETRLTLLPKSVATEQLAELQRSTHPNATLDRLSLFGGPSTIVRASPHQKNTYQGAILPSRPAHNLELLGRADVSGMPDWSGEDHYLFLTKYESEQDAPKPVVLRDQQATVRYAETRFSERNQFDFGRLAHKIGDQQYAVVGLLPGYYYVWSLPPSKLPELIRQSQNGDEAAIRKVLQPLSVVAVSPQQKKMFMETVAGPSAKFEPSHWKPMPTYRLLPFDAEFSSKPRTLIEMTRPLKFEPVDPDLDPFSAKTLPNESVGIKTEAELKLEDRRKSMTRAQTKMDEISKDHIPVGQPVIPGEVITTIDSEAAAKALRERMQPRPRRGGSTAGGGGVVEDDSASAATAESSLDQAKVEGLRRRIERMEQELAKAKRMLQELAPQNDENRPKPARR